MIVIDADALYKQLERILPALREDAFTEEVEIRAALDEIGKIPLVEARPVQHGLWRENPYTIYPAHSVIQCSECEWFIHKSKLRNSDKFNYCPNCGATMDAL